MFARQMIRWLYHGLILATSIAGTEMIGPVTLLPGDVTMPLLSLGTGPGLHGGAKGAYVACLDFLRSGGRHVDTGIATAEYFKGIGRAVEASGLQRAEVFLTSRIALRDMGYDLTLLAIYRSLRYLQLPYVDMLLLQAPGRPFGAEAEDPPCVTSSPAPRKLSAAPNWYRCRAESWTALVEAKKRGLTRAIGVAYYEVSHLEELRTITEERIAVNQFDFHRLWHKRELLEHCRIHAIQPIVRKIPGNPWRIGDLRGLAALAGNKILQMPELPLFWALHHKVAIMLWGAHRETVVQSLAAISTPPLPATMMQALDDDVGIQRDNYNDIPHGKTLFLSMCMGAAYFDRYCAPFLASFQRAYERFPPGMHSLHVWTIGVNQTYLNAARILFEKSSIVLEEAQYSTVMQSWIQDHNGSGDDLMFEDVAGFETSCHKMDGSTLDPPVDFIFQCDPGPHKERVNFNNVMFFKWVHEQLEITAGDGYKYVVIVDSDALFVKSLEQFLSNDVADNDSSWDFAFTYYDQEHAVPWGNNEEVAMTDNGFVRINAGVQILKHMPMARMFLDYLVTMSNHLVKQEEVIVGQAAILKEFKGTSQAALAALIGLENLKWERCAACGSSPVKVPVEDAGGKMCGEARVVGLPARFLNQAESLPDGRLTGDTHILHLKGTWWRMVMYIDAAVATYHRQYSWNWEAYELWSNMYRVWRPGHKFNLTVYGMAGSTAVEWNTTKSTF